MLPFDKQLFLSFIMLELFVTITVLAAVAIYFYIKRFLVRKSLIGYNVLITNNGSALSNELATILTTKYGCNALLLQTKSNDNRITLTQTSTGISTIHCNLLDYADLKQLNELIESEYGHIDIIIDNGLSIISNEITQNCGTFVDYTSERLRTTINLLMHFIPKMADLSRGHFVTVQTIDTQKKQTFSSNDDIKELINHLTVSTGKSTSSLELFNQPKIHLSTVLWSRNIDIQQNNNLDYTKTVDLRQLAEQIIDGIRANRSVIRVNHNSSYTTDRICTQS